MHWISTRTIVEEPAVSKEIDKLCKKYARFEDLYEAIKWLLARRCNKVDRLTKEIKGVEYCLYRVAGDVVARTPDVVLLYIYDDDQVNILGIKAEEAEESDD